MPKWIIVDTTYQEHLQILRRMRKIGRATPIRFVAETREETVVVAPIFEAFRLVSTGEVTVMSEPIWRLFTPDNYCLVQKLIFRLLKDVRFEVTTYDVMIVPPDNVYEVNPSVALLDYKTAQPIYEERIRK